MNRLNPITNCLDTMNLLVSNYYKKENSLRRICKEDKRELAVRLLNDEDVEPYEMLFLNNKKYKNLPNILSLYVNKEINSVEALDYIFKMILDYNESMINDFFEEFEEREKIFEDGDIL